MKSIDTSTELCLQLTFEPLSCKAPTTPTCQPCALPSATRTGRHVFFLMGNWTPSLLERAIEWMEEHIQAVYPHCPPPKGSKLFTNEADLQTLASVAGVSQGAQRVLHVDAVEQSFSRLVMQAMGQVPHQEALPDSARFFASVVFVRELMHQLYFPRMCVHGPDDHNR